MRTDAQKRDDEIYRLTDRLAMQLGWDGPNRPHHEGDLLTMADQALHDIQRGVVQAYHFLVIPYKDGTGLGYRAVGPEEKVDGCHHSAVSASRHLAKAEAVADHRYRHVGELIEGLIV